MAQVICKSQEFDGLLTEGKTYNVIESKGCSIQVTSDNGDAMWFGCKTFEYIKTSNT